MPNNLVIRPMCTLYLISLKAQGEPHLTAYGFFSLKTSKVNMSHDHPGQYIYSIQN